MKSKPFYKFFAAFLCIMLLTMLAQTTVAFAAENDDGGTLRIEYVDGNVPLSGVQFRVYRVAELLSHGNYELTGAFAGSGVVLKSRMTNSEWLNTSKTLAEYAREHNITANDFGETDAAGVLEFSDLRAGLYLIEGDAFDDGLKTWTPQVFCAVMPEEGGIVAVTPKFEITPLFGDLSVTKTVTGKGADTEREWHFVVTLSEPLNGQYGEMTFTDGEALFTLKHEEMIVAKDLPAGIRYVVKELDANTDGYASSDEHAVGKIVANMTVEVTFINKTTYDPDVPPPSDTPPQTGDNSHIEFWLAMLGISTIGLIASSLIMRRKRYK